MKRLILISLCTVFALAGFTGCGGSSSTPPPPPSIGKLYVTNGSTSRILRFKAGATGDVSPEGQAQVAPNVPIFLTLDVAHDRLAAVSIAGQSVLFLENASTTLSPVRVVSGAATTLLAPQSAALDSVADLLYVVDSFNSIKVFGPASTIAGNVAPVHSMTVLFSIGGFAVDAAANRLFVGDQSVNAIRVFDGASSLSGAVVADRVIGGTATQINLPRAVVLDNSGRLMLSNINSPSLLVFPNAATANGNVAPAAVPVLFSTPSPEEMAVSPAGELYEVNGDSAVAVYGNIATAAGNVSPTRVISGANTLLDPPFRGVPPLIAGVALDPTR